MKKWKIILIVTSFLLFFQNALCFRSFSQMALKGFENLLENPFFQAMFDLDEEEAVAVFGDREDGTFV